MGKEVKVQRTHSCAGCIGCTDEVFHEIGCRHLFQGKPETSEELEIQVQEPFTPVVQEAQIVVFQS